MRDASQASDPSRLFIQNCCSLDVYLACIIRERLARTDLARHEIADRDEIAVWNMMASFSDAHHRDCSDFGARFSLCSVGQVKMGAFSVARSSS